MSITVKKNLFPDETRWHQVQEPVTSFIKNMEETVQGLPCEHQPEILQEIHDWERLFFESYHLDSPVDKDREAAAHALLFLAFSLIEYRVIDYAKDPREKIKWVIFSNEIQEIVTAILPKELDVDAFIEADKKKQLEIRSRCKIAQLLKEIMPKIHKNFLELENKLYRNVDQINSDLEKKFKEMKQWLMHLNRERGAVINELHSEFEKLTQESVL